MAKLIVNSLNRYTVDSLYQWDINQVLYIHGLNIKDPEIHFTNNDLANAIPRIPTVDDAGVISVLIPNSLLQSASPITVYICGYEDSTYKTYFKVKIPVKARKKPGDYKLVVTDDEVYSFNALTKRVADLEKAFNVNETAAYYCYSYNSTTDTLSESSRKLTIYNYIPFVSSSLKAIRSIIDKIKDKIKTHSTTLETHSSNFKTIGEKLTTLTEGIDEAKKAHDWNVDENVGIIGKHKEELKNSTSAVSSTWQETVSLPIVMINSGKIYVRFDFGLEFGTTVSKDIEVANCCITLGDEEVYKLDVSSFTERYEKDNIIVPIIVKKGDILTLNLNVKTQQNLTLSVNNFCLLANLATPFVYSTLADSASEDFTTEDIINTLLGVE